MPVFRDDAQKTELYVQITVTVTATTLRALIDTATALSLPAGANVTDPALAKGRVAIFQTEGANVRFRTDGVAPTASVGLRMLPDNWYVFSGDLGQMQLIREGGADVKVNVEIYR